ncbi:hypothetical protein [Streptomyces calidiresistens]|nr:hypothetical protein [Streptomyces calidiresistens]
MLFCQAHPLHRFEHQRLLGNLPMGVWHASQVTIGMASRSRRRSR